MVNVNPPEAPEMVVIDGIKVRPEDEKRVRARLERQQAVATGAQSPVPIGVPPVGTDNRRRTASELYDGEPFDPAETVLGREAAPGGVPETDPAATADSGSEGDEKPKRGARKTAAAEDDAGK